MKNLLNLTGIKQLNKEAQQAIKGGNNVIKKRCNSSICSSVSNRCCGYDSYGNYGCVIAQPGARNCR